MDATQPIRSVVPTLDGAVLGVLARTTDALTVGEIHRLAASGSENGIRRTLSRLVREGTILSEERTVAVFYRANREHVAWPAIEMLTSLRRTLFERIRQDLESWVPPPVHASMFGSMARGDGNADSDIDILIIRPDGVSEDHETWLRQIDSLRHQVEAWTGNYCHIFQIDTSRLSGYISTGDALVEEWKRDEITLAGSPLRSVLRQLPRGGVR